MEKAVKKKLPSFIKFLLTRSMSLAQSPSKPWLAIHLPEIRPTRTSASTRGRSDCFPISCCWAGPPLGTFGRRLQGRLYVRQEHAMQCVHLVWNKFVPRALPPFSGSRPEGEPRGGYYFISHTLFVILIHPTALDTVRKIEGKLVKIAAILGHFGLIKYLNDIEFLFTILKFEIFTIFYH